MKVRDLKPGDMLDLENLNLPGAFGIAAQDEMARVESLDAVQGIIYTDLVNINTAGDEPLDVKDADAYRFYSPEGITTWTW